MTSPSPSTPSTPDLPAAAAPRVPHDAARHVAFVRRATWLCLGANAVLSVIDWCRTRTPASSVAWVVLGPGPNAVAVLALATGGVILFAYATANDEGARSARAMRIARTGAERFWHRCVVGAGLGLVVWEVLQRWGRLVFDWWDLVATGLGVVGGLAITRWVVPRAVPSADAARTRGA